MEEEVEVTEVEVEEVMEVKWEEAVVIEEDVKGMYCITQSVMVIVQYSNPPRRKSTKIDRMTKMKPIKNSLQME